MDGQPEILVVPGAEILGDDHAGAGGETHEKAHQGVDGGTGGAHGGQRLLADEVAHHDGVHGVVELLEQVADEQGDGKGHQLFPDHTLRHNGRGFAFECHLDTPNPKIKSYRITLIPAPFFVNRDTTKKRR